MKKVKDIFSNSFVLTQAGCFKNSKFLTDKDDKQPESAPY